MIVMRCQHAGQFEFELGKPGAVGCISGGGAAVIASQAELTLNKLPHRRNYPLLGSGTVPTADPLARHV